MANLPGSHTFLDVVESWVKPPEKQGQPYAFIE
jgi:hypothetical protein